MDGTRAPLGRHSLAHIPSFPSSKVRTGAARADGTHKAPQPPCIGAMEPWMHGQVGLEVTAWEVSRVWKVLTAEEWRGCRLRVADPLEDKEALSPTKGHRQGGSFGETITSFSRDPTLDPCLRGRWAGSTASAVPSREVCELDRGPLTCLACSPTASIRGATSTHREGGLHGRG